MSVSEDQLRESNAETRKHIDTVRFFLRLVCQKLTERGLVHDQSKLEEPEASTIAEYTFKLRDCTYGSEEYEGYRKAMWPALQHHYANNSHHPEHYPNGVDDMDLIDLVEMFCDWKAATLRHNDGNLQKSIKHNAERFAMTPQLAKIFQNTVRLVDGVKP